MSSPDFDAPPRDDIHPSPEEVRRTPVSRAPHPDEFDGPDDLEIDEEQVTRSRLPAVAWAKLDAEQPDYAHLEPGGREPVPGDKRFKIGAADIELLIKANGFDPKGPDSRIVFAFRGATLIDSDSKNDGVVAGVDTITLEETRPDHRTFRCTIGYLNRETRKISAFRASTVPNVKFMTNYYMWNNGLGGNSSTGANILPTGCYVYRMGAHGGGRIYPALRLTDPERIADDGQACVLRTKNDLTFKTDDVLDHCTPYDNIHCAYAYDSFSSAGCQTIQGPNGEGPWGQFQAVLRTIKVNTRIDYMLLTGREASLAAWLRDTGKAGDPEMVARWLGRLRPGSRGEAVARLQQQLGMKTSGYFGPSTKKKLGELQRGKGMLSDGIWSPRAEDKLGWSVFQAPAAPVAAPTTAETAATAAVPAPVAPAAPPVATTPAAPAAPVAPPPAAVPATPVPPVTPPASAPPATTPAVSPVVTPPAPATAAATPSVSPTIAATATSAAAAAATAAAAAPAATTTAPPVPPPAPAPVTEAPVAPRPTPAAPPPEPIKPAMPRPPGITPAVLAELEKLSGQPDGSAEAPGITELTAARSRSGSPTTAPAIVAGPKLVVDADRIAAFAPNALAQYREAFVRGNELMTRYGINQTPLRLCHFLGQIGNECGRLTIIEENMTYRSAQRLRAIWPSRFPSLASAEPYVNNPQKLAEKVYGGRFDNRPGDGWRYRGRGLVQITGRSSYREMGKRLGIDLENQPELASDPKYALAIACETWAGKTLPGERDMNRLADANKIESMTYRINGGFTNIDDRRDAFEEAWEIWGSGKAPRRPLEPDTLDRGDRAGRVEELNARLGELGLFEADSAVRPTQVFNLATYRAVCKLQESCGLNQSGVVAADTWAALEKSLEAGPAATRGASRSPGRAASGSASAINTPVASRMKEIRAWSIALSLLAVGFVATYIYALTHPTGNTPLWMPLVFAGMVFVTGLAMLLAAQLRLDPNGDASAGATTRGASRSAGAGKEAATYSFVPGEEEPVRLGVNV